MVYWLCVHACIYTLGVQRVKVLYYKKLHSFSDQHHEYRCVLQLSNACHLWDIVQCGLCEQWFHIKCVGLHSLPSIVQKNGIVHSVHKSRCVKMNFTFSEYLFEPAAAGSI